jgi:hypothetical protein
LKSWELYEDDKFIDLLRSSNYGRIYRSLERLRQEVRRPEFKGYTFLELVVFAREFAATDARDKVYALYGLTN